MKKIKPVLIGIAIVMSAILAIPTPSKEASKAESISDAEAMIFPLYTPYNVGY